MYEHLLNRHCSNVRALDHNHLQQATKLHATTYCASTFHYRKIRADKSIRTVNRHRHEIHQEKKTYFCCMRFLLFVVHTHVYLLFGWLIGGDLVCFLVLTWFLLLLLSDGSLQLVVHKVFERVQVSFSFILFSLQNDKHTRSTSIQLLP